MKRYYDKVAKKATLHNVESDTFIDCVDKQEWQYAESCVVWEEDVPRLRTAEEQEAYLEQLELASMTCLGKLELSRALKTLNLWKEEVKPLIKANEDFEDDWSNASVIDLTDPVFLQGFAQTTIDLDEVKREILKARD